MDHPPESDRPIRTDTTAKDAAQRTVVGAARDLAALSHRIHAHPELCYEEVRSSAWTAEALADGGFDVTPGIAGLPTAFEARAGRGPLHVVICAEYDALPGIGHACGHNVIAAAAVGAGLALAPLADALGMTVRVVGTPAEEGGGGKIYMLERGAFAGAHVALMVHPAPVEVLRPDVRAVAHLEVCYHGRESHASAAPELGVNAADAFVVAQTALGLLRQHLEPGVQVHGVVQHAGDVPNVVPARATGRWMVRAPDGPRLAAARRRVEACFEAGAHATGARLDVSESAPAYAEMVHDGAILARYEANARDLGRGFPEEARMGFSTDMGNVSLAIPSIHPTLAIESAGAMNHQPEFAAACITPDADRAIVDGAVAMAWTAVDLATGPERDVLLAGARHP